MANLARIYLKEMIKKECWDAMVVKGRSCNAFRTSLSVTNYPMRERTKDDLDELQYVLTQRKIEKAECDASKDLTPGPPSTRNTPVPGKESIRCVDYNIIVINCHYKKYTLIVIIIIFTDN